jgi:hypothetical protein
LRLSFFLININKKSNSLTVTFYER